MGFIRTVNGDVAPESLGVCYPHEHLLAMPPDKYAQADPDLVLDSESAAVESLNALKTAGGHALVEMTPIDYHRDPAGMARVAEQTMMHVIAITGYLKEKFSQPFTESQSVDEITQRMVNEITQGMDDTGIRAGAIKAASSLNQITANERKVFIGAAQAQQATGALISTHTEAGTMALEQIDVLTSHGVAPERILIGHLDRRLERDYHRRIADSGVYMGFDQIGKTKYAPDSERIALIQHLVEHGYEKQIMLSMDIARRSYLPAYGGAPGFAYLLETFVPMLRDAGVTDATIDGIIRHNPARALTIKEMY